MATATSMVRGQVRVINATYAELGPTSVRRALALVIRGDAIISESTEDGRTISAENLEFPYPLVIKLLNFVNVPFYVGPQHVSKTGVRKRDGGKCAYCSKEALTVDHILPQSRGGKDTWENLVASCTKCNSKKADRTPEEAGMPLLFQPSVPTRIYLTGGKRKRKS